MLVIGRVVKRNLQEQVAENMKQIDLILQKLDGLDVYDNVITIEDLSNLSEEQLAIVARPVSFIVYQDIVYVKKGNVGAYALFSPYYSIEEDEYITIKSSELRVQFPLGEVTISNLEVELYDKDETDVLLTTTKAQTLLACYPVGAIYMSTISTSPASLFGGTWEQIENRFLLSAGSSYSAGATGGEATHALTVNEMPSHDHELQDNGTARTFYFGTRSEWSGQAREINNSAEFYRCSNQLSIGLRGGGQPHNNMPPYLVVYMWKRTA